MNKKLKRHKIKHLVKMALAEDKAYHDITSLAVIEQRTKANFEIVFREKGVLCGIEFAKEAFLAMDKKVEFKILKKDGQKIDKNEIVAYVSGEARAILAAERTALNFLAHLSGIATLTADFVEAIKGSKINITDTRKTLPGLREIEKYAVRMGGGVSHRMDLAQSYLIKDNHLAILKEEEKIKKPIEVALERVAIGKKEIEVEVKNLREFREALKLKTDIIMLDNMNRQAIKKALQLKKKLKPSVKIEVSGGITLANIKSLSNLDIDYISIGKLTHSAKSIDVSLEIT